MSHLHHPTLNEFTLLPGITTVDNLVSLTVKTLYRVKLLLNTSVGNEFDTKTLWNHRQSRQRPITPVLLIIIGFFQLTEMTKGPRHLVPISFHVTIVRGSSSQYACDIACHTGFLRYTNYHLLSSYILNSLMASTT